MKIAIFGGTFDPIHIGHLIVAEFSVDFFGLDKVIFVPSKVSPFKVGKSCFFSDEDRLKMIELAIEGNPRFEVSDFEIKRDEISYTYITVKHFLNVYKGNELFLIIGGDTFEGFTKWKEYKYILENVKLIVYPRLGYSLEIPKEIEVYRNKITFLEVPLIGISSTLIRQRIENAMSIRYLVRENVYEYILNKFYNVKH
ncbi:MAG: nicotinate-nucleotide adenylyltransferase [Brevinematia bacterium]